MKTVAERKLYNPEGCHMSNTILPLEIIILLFREVQVSIGFFILYKLSKFLLKEWLKKCCVLTILDNLKKLFKVLIESLKNIYIWRKNSKYPVPK